MTRPRTGLKKEIRTCREWMHYHQIQNRLAARVLYKGQERVKFLGECLRRLYKELKTT